MKNVKPQVTEDAFGNQLEVGDIVYYVDSESRKFPLKIGTVTHFTKTRIAVDGFAREFYKIAKVNGTAKPEPYDDDEEDDPPDDIYAGGHGIEV